ncbi:hypothetical protein NQ317_005216 [Molorchus minor]|uniref:Enhancer of mRNA-decapping protein 4 WD40 repeat region domain-containing protein n=1 Tax=Molorchus minor TaxID=1323400 RepID=A0ABQ9JQ08_9CUCU|nr:hypothetical protein NQ317_005216 [Molorchus minor]
MKTFLENTLDPTLNFPPKLRGETVVVHCNQGIHSHGSSKVKLIDRIDYNWEFRYYHGHLVAAHINGKVIAYGMKGKDGGMLRVTNQETNHRTLIKNLKEDIKDLAFAYSRNMIMLGCVDNEGNILVYEIEDSPNSISYTLLLHVYHHKGNRSKTNYKLIWCPYLPSSDEEIDSTDDPEKMFVVLNGNRAEVYNVAMLTSKYGCGPLDPDEDFEGYIEINHSAELVDASFSSDGTAIAIASSDGYVKFFQLYMFDNEKQKCLHEWRPHDGQPLSSIIFIDNVLEYSSECWKFTITGANNNSEIKLWSCESWTCLQTIHFKADPSSLITSLYLNISIDYTGQFLVISDINNRVMYAMQLKRIDKEQMVHVTMLAQFLLPAPFLSFHILEAANKKIPYSYNNSNEDLYDDNDDFDEDSEITAVCLKMLVIQPKKFQECNITFQPEALYYNTLNNLSTKDNICDELEENDKVPKLDDLQNSVTLLIQQQSTKSNMTLMTPDDFTSSGGNSRPNSVRNSISNEGASSATKSIEKLNETIVDNLIDFERPQKDNFASGGSSPSREVQEILSLNNSNYTTQEYLENLSKMHGKQEEPQKENDNQTENLIYEVYDPSEDMVWPKIPVVKENDIKNEDLSQLQAINYRINSLESIIREQNILIQKLHQDRMDKEEFIKEIDSAMSKQHLQVAKLLESLVAMQKTRERDLQEQIVSSVNQLLMKTLAEKLQQLVAQEMKHILPAIHNLIESYRHQVDGQYSQRMTNTEMMLKENVAKVFDSKTLADTLSLSVINVVAPGLEKCYRDIISSSLIPSWEKVCGQMFQQINETFTRGTKECKDTASVENYMDRQRRVQEKGKDLITQMQAVSDNMKTNADKLTSTLTSEIHKQFSSVFKRQLLFAIMQDKLTTNLKEIVSEQVKLGFKSHAAVIEDSVMNAVRSRAVTPSPHVDSHATTLAQIQQQLSRGNYDAAFQFALSAENLTYVIYVCERVDIQKLFGEECLLQQSCLLALIQQLSMELHKNTELKLSFIRAAFLALSPDYANTKQYIPKVLRDLIKQLNAFIQSSPPTEASDGSEVA